MKVLRQLMLAAMAAGLHTAPIKAAPQSKQQIYDAAQTAFDAGNWAAAIAGFLQIAGPATNPAPTHTQALLHARMAQAYYFTGQFAAAAASARFAANALTAPGDVAEAADAWATLGDVALHDLAMADAIAAYRNVLARATAPDDNVRRLNARIGIAHAAMVTDPPLATATLDAIVADKAVFAALTPLQQAQIDMLRGRAQLNAGNPRAAMPLLLAAVDRSGGANGNKVNLVQVEIRGDVGIGYELLGDEDALHKFVARTGAGHLKSLGWLSTGSTMLPLCTSDTMRPDDTAVVQFNIAADGSVRDSTAIYASRSGMTGIAFAEAVRKWTFKPAEIAKLDPFWRTAVRVQMRCLTHVPTAGMNDRLLTEVAQWFEVKNAAETKAVLDSSAVIGPDDPRLARDDALGLLVMYRRSAQLDHDDPALDARLDKALDAQDAPPSLRAIVLVSRFDVAGKSRGQYARALAARYAEVLPGFDARWPDSYAGAWLRTEYAIQLEKGGELDAARPELAKIVALPARVLPADDNLRTVATLHLASLTRKAGDPAAAAARVADAGLSPEQCALVDVRPVMTGGAVSGEDFPQAALAWQFDGYVRYAFDIDAEGRVRNTRTVLAYPPFLFNAATEKTVQRFRYVPPMAGGTAVGCSERVDSIVYHANPG